MSLRESNAFRISPNALDRFRAILYLHACFSSTRVHFWKFITFKQTNKQTTTTMNYILYLRKIAETTEIIRFYTAVERGDSILAMLLIELGADVSNGDAFNKACALGFTDLVQRLMELPPERCPNIQNKNNRALLFACENGHTEIVRLLLEPSAIQQNSNTSIQQYSTLLKIACKKGFTDIVRLFLRFNYDSLKTHLSISCELGHTEIVRLLLEVVRKNASKSKFMNVAKYTFEQACKHGHMSIVMLEMMQNEEITRNGAEIAAGYGHIDILRMFQTGDLSPALEAASLTGQTEIVRFLLDKGGHSAASINSAFRFACHKRHTKIVRLLLDLPLECGVNPAAEDNEAIRGACQRGHTEIVRLLLDLPLECGVNPAAEDNEAIRGACQRGHTEIVRLLLDLPLERGIDPAAVNNAAIWGASQRGHMEIVRLLLNKGCHSAASINEAIRVACQSGHTEIVRLLLDLQLERDDYVALQSASEFDHIEIVRLLLERGGIHRNVLERVIQYVKDTEARYNETQKIVQSVQLSAHTYEEIICLLRDHLDSLTECDGV